MFEDFSANDFLFIIIIIYAFHIVHKRANQFKKSFRKT